MKEMIEIEKVLFQGFKALGLDSLDPAPFITYLELLSTWNKAYNLTAIRKPLDMAHKHILDSLAILPWLKGNHIIDVGTGPGLPGIPIAIVRPELNIVLLDSNGKKIRFLKEVVRVLSLKQVEVIHARVEDYGPEQRFDTIVTRAFSSMDSMIEKTRHLINPKGIWLAMKGKVPENELNVLDDIAGIKYDVRPYSVEPIDGDRCCILIKSTT